MEFKGPKGYIKALQFLMKDNPKYNFFYDFILKNAIEKKRESFTKEEKKELDEILQGEKFPGKECYDNSRRLILRRKGNKLDYYEGWVDVGFLPVEHAWCEYNGKIVDVTLVERKPDELKDIPKKYRDDVANHTKKYQKAVYYGVKIPKCFVFHELLNNKTYNILSDFAFTCIKPLKEGRKPPSYCGDLSEYKV